jgi:DNA repair protein RadC
MPTLTEQLAYTLQDRSLLLGEPDAPYVLRVRDLPEQEKPREKMLSLGPAHLSVAELMAIVWGVGSKREDVLAMARRTLREYGDAALTHESNPERLSEAADIPLQKACQVIASLELGRRFYASHAGRATFIRTAKQAHAYLKDIGTSQKEQLRGLYLGSRHQIVHDEVISVGTLTSNLVHPREIFQPAIQHNAIAVIIAHNHPSGILEPTGADIAVTRQIIAAGKVLGIDLLDHLIITGNRYTSVLRCLDND